MATAFKAILKFVCEGSKRTFQHSCTASDVTAEFYLFEDGNSICTLPGGEGVVQLADVIITGNGAGSVSQALVYVNGKNTGEVILHAANIASNQARQFAGVPIRMAPGASLRITQLT